MRLLPQRSKHLTTSFMILTTLGQMLPLGGDDRLDLKSCLEKIAIFAISMKKQHRVLNRERINEVFYRFQLRSLENWKRRSVIFLGRIHRYPDQKSVLSIRSYISRQLLLCEKYSVSLKKKI